MKIGIFNNDFDLGGVQTVSISLANKLAKFKKYDVNLVSVFQSQNSLIEDLNSEFTLYSLNCKRKLTEKFVLKLSFLLKKQTSLAKYSQSIIEEIDHFLEIQHFDIVIVSQGILSVLMSKVIESGKHPHVKFISWQHSSYETYFNNYYRKFSEELYNALKIYDYLVVLTENDLEKFSGINKNTFKIYNLCKEFANNSVCKINNKNLIYTGRLDIKTKGLDTLLKAFSQLDKPDWNLILVGEGPDSKRLNRFAVKLQIKDRVLFTGIVKRNIQEYYRKSAIFVLPSRWEGFGLSLIEAMSLGLPVISSKTNGPVEILEEGKYGYMFEIDDVNELVKALDKFMSSYQLRKEFQDKSLKRSADFNNEKVMNNWLKIIEGRELL